jgi:hypothetical protein
LTEIEPYIDPNLKNYLLRTLFSLGEAGAIEFIG